MTIRRQGVFLIEVAAALVLLGALAAIVAQTVAWSAAERRASERREIALSEAANAMERLAATDWESLAPEAATEEALSAAAKQMLPGGRITREIQATTGSPPAKRIAVEVQYRNQAGEAEAPVRLTTWVYK
jgi:Tfp pilus assembly protein PilE